MANNLSAVAASVFGYLRAKFGKPSLMPQSILSGAYVSDMPGQMLPNPNEVLQRMAGPEGIRYFRRVRQAIAFVAGIVKLRIDAVLALFINGWVAQPGDPNDEESIGVAAVCKAAIDNIPDLIPALRKLMMCVPDGVSFGEVIWGLFEANVQVVAPTLGTPSKSDQTLNDDAIYGSNEEYDAPKVIERTDLVLAPVRLIDLPPENFVYDRDFNLRMRTKESPWEGVAIDPMQIVVGRYGSAAPYGEGDMTEILTDCFKYDWIDRKGMEILERQGLPLVLVYAPESWDDTRILKVLSWSKRTYKNFMVIRLGDQFKVVFPNQTATPTYIGDDQIKRLTALQDSMSIGYLGVSFSNSQARHSGNDQASVKNEMRFEKTPGDAATLVTMLQALVDKICTVNYPSLPQSKWPKVKVDTKPTIDVATRLTVYQLADELNVPWSIRQFCEDLGVRLAEGAHDRVKPKALPGLGTQQPGGLTKGPLKQVERQNTHNQGVSVMTSTGELLYFKTKADFQAAFSEVA